MNFIGAFKLMVSGSAAESGVRVVRTYDADKHVGNYDAQSEPIDKMCCKNAKQRTWTGPDAVKSRRVRHVASPHPRAAVGTPSRDLLIGENA